MLFPIESLVFFSTIEIKKTQNKVKENENNDQNTNKENSAIKPKDLQNPIVSFEGSKKIRKYENLRKRRTDKKISRGSFILSRTNSMGYDELKHFEQCKEEKIFNEKSSRKFQQFIKDNCQLNPEDFPQSNLIMDYIGYQLNYQIKNLYESTIRKKCNGEYKYNYTEISADELKDSSTELIQLLNRRIKLLKSKLDNKVETKSFKLFKEGVDQYLDQLVGDEESFLTINQVKDDKGDISIQSTVKKRLKNQTGTSNNVSGDNQPVTETEDKSGNEMSIEDPDNSNENVCDMNALKKEILILDMIDNPMVLWRNLLAKVRNCWIERYLFQSDCYKKLRLIIKEDCYTNESLENDSLLKKRVTDKINRIHFKCEFASFAKPLLKNHYNYCEGIRNAQLKPEFKKICSEIFKSWFFEKFIIKEDASKPVDSGQLNPAGEKNSNVKKKKRLERLWDDDDDDAGEI